MAIHENLAFSKMRNEKKRPIERTGRNWNDKNDKNADSGIRDSLVVGLAFLCF